MQLDSFLFNYFRATPCIARPMLSCGVRPSDKYVYCIDRRKHTFKLFTIAYFKKDDKSTSYSLRLNSATALGLDDTIDSGKPLQQLTHLLKSHLQTVGYDKTAVLGTHISSVNGRFAVRTE